MFEMAGAAGMINEDDSSNARIYALLGVYRCLGRLRTLRRPTTDSTGRRNLRGVRFHGNPSHGAGEPESQAPRGILAN